MSRARIKVNGVAGSQLAATYGAVVQLTNDNDGSENTYTWSIVAKPAGSAAVLSSTSAPDPTFTVDLEGTYLVRLVVDTGQATEVENRVVVSVLQSRTGIRVPAARERDEADSAAGRTAGEGWAPDFNAALRLADELGWAGLDMIASADPAIAVGKVVQAGGAGGYTLPSGEQIPVVELADGTREALGIVLKRMTHNASLVVVRMAGPYLGVNTVGRTQHDPGWVDAGTPGSITFVDPGGGEAPVCTVLTVGATGLVLLAAPGITALTETATLSDSNPTTIQPDDAAAPGVAGTASRSDHRHPIVADTPIEVSATGVSSEGVATSFARSDHHHNVIGGTTLLTTTINATSVKSGGSSNGLARADHIHDITTGAPGASCLSDTPGSGASAEIARADHVHQSNTAPANVTKAAAVIGASGEPARADHKHDIDTAAPGATGVATASAEGASTSLARADHVHQSNTAPANVTKAAAAIGASGEPARADHKHDIDTAAPVAVGNANAEGSATSLARSDHVHQLLTRMFVGCAWAATDIAASLSNEALPIAGETGSISPVTQMSMLRAGSITGIAARLNAIVATGTLTITVAKNGIATGAVATITSGSNAYQTFTIGDYTFAAGDRLQILISTSVDFTPDGSADGIFIIEITTN